MASAKVRLFIEATPLLDRYMSGIGHLTLRQIEVLSSAAYQEQFEITLIVPFDKMPLLKARTGSLPVRHKSIPLPSKILYGLWKFNLVPPLDLWLGKGVYFFPNYRNWRSARSRNLTYVHDLSFKLLPHTVSPLNQRFLERNIPAWLSQTDLVAALSSSTKRDLVQAYAFPPEKVAIVPAGIDLDLFYPRPDQEITAMREQYHVPANYFMFLSTLEPRKDVMTLLEAYENLPPKVQNQYALLLVGASGWLNEGIVTKIKTMQDAGLRVIWPQTFVPDEDLPALLSGAACLIHPALYEGFGITPLEAMACKTPVIVAKNSSLPEVVGDAGVYFKTGDANELCEKILSVLTHPEATAKKVERAYNRAQQCTWKHAAGLLAESVMRLAPTRRKS